MINYYSKNKRDHSAEQAKIEQKRYEELLLQERINRKVIVNAKRASTEEKTFCRSISNEIKSTPYLEESLMKNSLISEFKEKKIDEKEINLPRKSLTPINKNSSKKSNQKSFQIESIIIELPQLSKHNSSKISIKKSQKGEV